MSKKATLTVPVEISARHVHLTQAHLEKLFGRGYVLPVLRPLSQPGEFASAAVVTVKTKKGSLSARVLGPLRPYSQVELSRTDAFALGVEPPIRESGDLAGTPSVTLVGPAGSIRLREGLVLAYRHIHCSTTRAKELGVKHGRFVKIRIESPRAVVYEKVMLKVSDHYDWHLHLDTDEGNAAGVVPGMRAEVII